VGLRSKCDLRGAFSSAAADHSPHVDQPMSTNGLSLSPLWRPPLPTEAGSDARERRLRVRPARRSASTCPKLHRADARA
jgi:hypothetical protein